MLTSSIFLSFRLSFFNTRTNLQWKNDFFYYGKAIFFSTIKGGYCEHKMNILKRVLLVENWVSFVVKVTCHNIPNLGTKPFFFILLHEEKKGPIGESLIVRAACEIFELGCAGGFRGQCPLRKFCLFCTTIVENQLPSKTKNSQWWNETKKKEEIARSWSWRLFVRIFLLKHIFYRNSLAPGYLFVTFWLLLPQN